MFLPYQIAPKPSMGTLKAGWLCWSRYWWARTCLSSLRTSSAKSSPPPTSRSGAGILIGATCIFSPRLIA